MVVHARDPLFLETLTGALRARGHQVHGATANERMALALAARHHPDVCVLDAGAGSGWREVAYRLRTREPRVKLVLVGGRSASEARSAYDDQLVDALVDQGCDFGQLDTALLTTVRGGRCRAWARRPARDTSATSLTHRERQVLEGLSRGSSTFGIAQDLGISAHTVRTHVQGVLRKLDVHTRGRAVSVALSENLLQSRAQTR